LPHTPLLVQALPPAVCSHCTQNILSLDTVGIPILSSLGHKPVSVVSILISRLYATVLREEHRLDIQRKVKKGENGRGSHQVEEVGAF
jgi:hypothetical protein